MQKFILAKPVNGTARARSKRRKSKALPSAAEMRAFRKRFYKEEWEACCEDAEFLTAVGEDLALAEKISIELLSNL
jgi:hypothetical protein